MSVLLVTRPGRSLGHAGRGGRRRRRPTANTAWWMEALRWIDERLAELELGEPPVDYVRLGQEPREGSVAWAMVTRLDVRPLARNPGDGTADFAMVQMAITCLAGQDMVRSDPMAAMAVAGRVFDLLDEHARTGLAAHARGGPRGLTLALNRARIEDVDAGESRAVRLPAVLVDEAVIYSG